MTEDASPENLRKFLESDDPAMVMMGLSMAKGSGVPDELLPTILSLYMWDDDKTIRAAAKSVFIKFAPEELKEKVKKNWKASYRTIDSYKFPKAIHPFLKAFESQDDFAEIALKSLTKALGDENEKIRRSAAGTLGGIGERAVEPLIKTLKKDDDCYVRRSAIQALERIGNPRAVKPLIKVLDSRDKFTQTFPVYDHYDRQLAARALGKIDGKRAVKPLIKALRGNSSAAEALGDIGDERAVKPLIKAFGGPLGRGDGYYVRIAAAKALGKIGDKRAVEPLTIIRSGYEGRWEVRRAIENALKKLGHEV